MVESPDDTDDLSSYSNKEISTTGSNVGRKSKVSSKSMLSITAEADSISAQMEHDSGALMDASVIKESLDTIYQQLEEISQNNVSQYRKISEKNKECQETKKRLEKNVKEMNETMKLQHSETRRRLDRLEKKSNAGYFN